MVTAGPGSRQIVLFIPFEVMGVRVETITLRPFELDMTLRWNDGLIASPLALLAELSGLQEAAIRQLRYPDASRVMDEFMAHVPPGIREDIDAGRKPQGLVSPEDLRPDAASDAGDDQGDDEPRPMRAMPPMPAAAPPPSPSAQEEAIRRAVERAEAEERDRSAIDFGE